LAVKRRGGVVLFDSVVVVSELGQAEFVLVGGAVLLSVLGDVLDEPKLHIGEEK